MSSPLVDVLIGVVLMALLLASLETGYRGGRRAMAEHDGHAATQIGAVQGAVLGLLGLLLGFSFAAAGTRFLERQDLIVREANAIGTAYLRAGLLPEPHREQLRSELRAYTASRVEMSANLRDGLTREMNDLASAAHVRMWNAAEAGVLARPDMTLAVVPAVNEVIDLHTIRVSAGRKHLPVLVMGLLVACSLMSLGVIGFGCGLSGKRRLQMTVPLVLLIGAALWVTIDLDHPRAGLMRLSDAPLKELRLGDEGAQGEP